MLNRGLQKDFAFRQTWTYEKELRPCLGSGKHDDTEHQWRWEAETNLETKLIINITPVSIEGSSYVTEKPSPTDYSLL